jgi:hypothetical protein
MYKKTSNISIFSCITKPKASMLLRMCKLQTLKAVMSLKNKTVPFRFLSVPRAPCNAAEFTGR